jgi:hypothetical protein
MMMRIIIIIMIISVITSTSTLSFCSDQTPHDHRRTHMEQVRDGVGVLVGGVGVFAVVGRERTLVHRIANHGHGTSHRVTQHFRFSCTIRPPSKREGIKNSKC